MPQSMRAITWLTMLTVLSLMLPLLVASTELDTKDAATLIENTPDFSRAEQARHCPKSELLWTNKGSAVFQIRNTCPTSGSGLIGNYTVDLRTAQVWIGVDRTKLIESKRLRSLQEHLRKKLRGTKGEKQSRFRAANTVTQR